MSLTGKGSAEYIAKEAARELSERLKAIAHNAANYDGLPEPHCVQCGHDEAAILDAMDELAKVSPAIVQSAISRAEDAEQKRWQDAIYERCKKAVGPANYSVIDGAGCDSGDPLDFTLAEIGQALAFVQDAAEERERRMREALTKLMKYPANHEKWPACSPVCVCGLVEAWGEAELALRVSEGSTGE